MKNTSLTRALFVAGAVALAGAAQAQTFDSPMRAGEASTMTGGEPNALTTNSPYSDGTVVVDTRVLGAGPAVVTTYGTTYYGPYYYVQSTPPMTRDVPNRTGGVYSTSHSGSYYGN